VFSRSLGLFTVSYADCSLQRFKQKCVTCWKCSYNYNKL